MSEPTPEVADDPILASLLDAEGEVRNAALFAAVRRFAEGDRSYTEIAITVLMRTSLSLARQAGAMAWWCQQYAELGASATKLEEVDREHGIR